MFDRTTGRTAGNDDRREEDHSRVEVQHRRDDCLETQQRGKERNRPSANSLDARAERGEQSVGLDNDADQEQAGNQYKRRPGLPGSLTDRSAHYRDRTRRFRFCAARFRLPDGVRNSPESGTRATTTR